MTTREVILDGGSPWGFRMHGGADVGQPLRISRVNPGSKAAQRGVREGDVISSINGQATRHITNSEAHGLLKSAGHTLQLGLNEESSGSPKRRAFRGQHQHQDSRSTESIKRSSSVSSTGSAGSSASVKTTVTVNGSASEATHTAPATASTATTPATSTASTDTGGPTVNGSSTGDTKKDTLQQNGSVTKEVTITTSTSVHTSTDTKERRDSEPSPNNSTSAVADDGDGDAARRLLREAGAEGEDTPRRRQQKRGSAHGAGGAPATATGAAAKGVGSTASGIRPPTKANESEAKNSPSERIGGDARIESPEDSTTTPEAIDTPPVGRRKRQCVTVPGHEGGASSESSQSNLLGRKNDVQTLTTGSVTNGKEPLGKKEYEKSDSTAIRGNELNTSPGTVEYPPPTGKRRRPVTDKKAQGQASELLRPKTSSHSHSRDGASTQEDSSTPDVGSPAIGRRSKLNRLENTKTSSSREQDLESKKKEVNNTEMVVSPQTSGRNCRRSINNEPRLLESSAVPKIEVVDMSAYGYVSKPSEDVLSPEASAESGSGAGGIGSGGGDEEEAGEATVLSRAKRRRLRAQRARRRSEIPLADTQGKPIAGNSGKNQGENILREEDVKSSSLGESRTTNTQSSGKNSTTVETLDQNNTGNANKTRNKRINNNFSNPVNTNDSRPNSKDVLRSTQNNDSTVGNNDSKFTESFQRELKVSATHQEDTLENSISQQVKRFVRRSTKSDVSTKESDVVESTMKKEVRDASERVIISSTKTRDSTLVSKRETVVTTSKQQEIIETKDDAKSSSKSVCAPEVSNSHTNENKENIEGQERGNVSQQHSLNHAETNNKTEKINQEQTEDLNKNSTTVEDETGNSHVELETIQTTNEDTNTCKEIQHELSANGEESIKTEKDDVACRRRKVVRMASQEELLDAVEEVSGLCESPDAGCVLPATSVQAGVGSGRDSRVFEEVLVAPFVIQDDAVSSSTTNIPLLSSSSPSTVSNTSPQRTEGTSSRQKDEVELSMYDELSVSNVDNSLIENDSKDIKYLSDSVYNKTEPIDNSNKATVYVRKKDTEDTTSISEIKHGVINSETTTEPDESDGIICKRNDWKQFEERWKRNLSKFSHELDHNALTEESSSTSGNETVEIFPNHRKKLKAAEHSHVQSMSRISEQDVETETVRDTLGTLCDVADNVRESTAEDLEDKRETSFKRDTSSKAPPVIEPDARNNEYEIIDHEESVGAELSLVVSHKDQSVPETLQVSLNEDIDISVDRSNVVLLETSLPSKQTKEVVHKIIPEVIGDLINTSVEKSVVEEKLQISQTIVSEVKETESSLSVVVSDAESRVFPETSEQYLAHPNDEKVGVNYRGDAAITVAEMGNQLCLAHSSKKDDDAATGSESVAMEAVTRRGGGGGGDAAAEEVGDGGGDGGGGGAARRPSVSRNVRRGGIDVSVQRADGCDDHHDDDASVPSATADAVLCDMHQGDVDVTERALVTEQRGQFTVFTLDGSSTSSASQIPAAEDTLEFVEKQKNVTGSGEIDDRSSSVAIASLTKSDEVWEEAQELVIIEYDPDNPPNNELLDNSDLVRSNTTPVQRDEGEEEYEDAEEGYYEEEEDERELTEEEVELLDARPAMPSEEEESLRCFLRTLQLVETPDKPRRTSLEENEEVAALRKATKKRVADATAEYYAQFFPPARSLDVIVEETSDVSDNERKNESSPGVTSVSDSSGHPQVIKSVAGEDVIVVDSGDVQSPEEEDEVFQEVEDELFQEGDNSKTVIVTSSSASSVHVTQDDGFCVRRVFQQRSWVRTGVGDPDHPHIVISEAVDVASGSDSPEPEQRVELPDSSSVTSPASNEEPEEVLWARGEASAPQTTVEVVFLDDDSASEAASASVGGGVEGREDELEEPLREAAVEHIARVVRMARAVEVMTCELDGDSGGEAVVEEEEVTVTPRESDNARQDHAVAVEDGGTTSPGTSQDALTLAHEVTATFSAPERKRKEEEEGNTMKIDLQERTDETILNIENIDQNHRNQKELGDGEKISLQQTPDSVHTDSFESAPTETLDGVASISSDSFEVINVTVLDTRDELKNECENANATDSALLQDLKIRLDDIKQREKSNTAVRDEEVPIKTLDSIVLSTKVINDNASNEPSSIRNIDISDNENSNKNIVSELNNLEEGVTSFIESDVPDYIKIENGKDIFSHSNNSGEKEFKSADRGVERSFNEISPDTETSISIEGIEDMKRLQKEVAESLAQRESESNTDVSTLPKSSETYSNLSETPTCRVGFARGAGLCYINLPPQKPQVSLTPPTPEESVSAPNDSEILSSDKDFVQKLMHQDLNSSSVYSLLSSLTLAQVARLSPELKHNLEALMGLQSRSNTSEVEEVRNASPHLAPTHSHQGSSSSDSTSHNTALFNPSVSRTSSPLADISASYDDRETPGEGRTPLPLDTPPALRVLALESVLALPRGLDVLRALEAQLVKKQEPPPPPARRHLPAKRGQQLASISRSTGTLPGVSSPHPSPLPVPPPETWTAIPSDEDPRVLLCLSPSQMKELSLHENVSAHQLLDLHRKFSERRGYHESPPATPPRPPPAPPRRLLGGSSGDSTPCSICSPPPSRAAEGIRAHLSPRALHRMQQQIASANASPSPTPPPTPTPRRGGRHIAAATPIPGTSPPLTSPRAKIPASERLPAILRGSALCAADSSPSEMLKFVRRPEGSATPDSAAGDAATDTRPQMQRATSWFGDEDPNRAARLKAQLLSEWLTLARGSAPCSRSSTPAPGGVCSPASSISGGKNVRSAEEKEGYRRLTEQLSSLSQQLEENRAHKKRFSLPPDAQRTQQVREEAQQVRPMNGEAMRSSGATTLPPMSPRTTRLNDDVEGTPKEDEALEPERKPHETTPVGKGNDIAEGAQSASQDEEEQLIRQLQRQESSQEESDPVLTPTSTIRRFDADQYVISKQGDIAVLQSDSPPSGSRTAARPPQVLPVSTPGAPTAPTDGEFFRQQMYEEYMHKVCERAERRRHRVIRISTRSDDGAASTAGPGPLSPPATAPPPHLETEFLGRVRERMDKLGLRYDSEGEEATTPTAAVGAAATRAQEAAGAGDAAYVIEAGDGYALQAEEVQALPKHLQEILLLPSDSDTEGPAMIAPRFKATSPVPGVWTPGAKASAAASASDGEATQHPQQQPSSSSVTHQDATPPSPQGPPSGSVWTPRSASVSPVAERREFRPVKFESPTLQRKNRAASASPAPKPPSLDIEARSVSAASTPPASSASTSGPLPPWEVDAASTIEAQRQQLEQLQQASAAALLSSRLVQSQSAPASGLSGLAATSQRLPRAQNPTITLLQKAREGQLPRGAHYLDRMNSRESDKDLQLGQNDIMYSVKKEYQKETETGSKKVVELTPRKFEGIGPTTTDGIPIVLRSEIKEPNQAKWYKRMYDSLHKSGKDGHYPYTSAGGYLSEPEPLGYDSDIGFTAKYATLDRRRIKNKENDFTTSTLPRSKYLPHSAAIKYGSDIYKNQPGRIEDYEPGHSSISDKETKQWWDEVLDIFDGWLDTHAPSSNYRSLLADSVYQRAQSEQKMMPSVSSGKPFMSYALKESGYESDSTLVFKRRDENLQNQLSPEQQKLAYKTIQRGGEVPLHGLRKPAPERPKESPHRYVESEVTIHYRSPVRAEQKEVLPEEELARRQAEAMRRIYQEERRRKYLQELQDMQSRRHTDNFTPSQKSPISLNRYDDILDDLSTKHKTRDRTPEPKLVARALYNFVGQTSRELSFRRGDIIFVRRQIDKNWYEGEHNAMVGLFPLNYVEIIPYDGIRTMPKRPTEGQARAKFNFVAQTHLELSLVKGELVVLTRRVDENWYEGRIGNKKGIFPVSYVEVLSEPGERAVTPSSTSNKPVSSTTSRSLLTNGSTSKQTYQTYQSQQIPTSSYYNRLGTSYTANNPYATMPRQGQTGRSNLAPMTQTLHIDTHSEPVPYRALYNYRPQNEDELELVEGDTVYVMEKCDDGWYVGSSQRTGFFGTFPGNYVERL